MLHFVFPIVESFHCVFMVELCYYAPYSSDGQALSSYCLQ